MKKQFSTQLESHPNHKAIVITNTVERATECQHHLDLWLDSNNKLKGDTVLVVGDRDSELKLAYTSAFTNEPFKNDHDSENSNTLKPRFLLGAAGCIGAGLDCCDVHFELRLAIPTSIINFIQEMGRCGRTFIQQNNIEYCDTFSISFCIYDFVYIWQRIVSTDINDTNATLITTEEFISMEFREFKYVCSMMYLNYGCWHNYLENASTNPETDPYNPTLYSPCVTNCPFCTNEIKKIIKCVDKDQLCLFLVSTMTNTTKIYNAIQLGDALYTYPSCGTLIYHRKSAQKAEKRSNCHMTIIQLLLRQIVDMVLDKESNKWYCILPHDNFARPLYLDQDRWRYINTF